MNDDQIKHMVERFLRWKLPANFSTDSGISFEKISGKGTPYEFVREGALGPSGTNLFDATQATEMVRHMVEGLAPPAPAVVGGMTSTEAVQMMNRCKSEIALLRAEVARLKPKADAYDNLSIVLDLLPKRSQGASEDLVWTLDKRIRELTPKPDAAPAR